MANDVDKIYQELITYLKLYEEQRRGSLCQLVHGDPVFSNCILSGTRVFFFDMNGRQADRLTTQGDCTYDLAKILQSLYGYDFIILDVPLHEDDELILAELRQHLRKHISSFYPSVNWIDVQLICASLLFSLIPLHENEDHRPRFFNLCRKVLNCALDA